MNLGIEGKVALVGGASRGLGFACAAALADEGVQVTLVARSEEPLKAAAQALLERTGREAAWVAADLATEEGREKALRACKDPDILVTNAGGPPSRDFRDLDLIDWGSALHANFLSSVELIRATINPMSKRGWGRIVNITSMTVRMPVTNLDLSNAARLALTGYVAGVSRQVASTGVTINNLLPGPIATERLKELGATAEGLIARVPAGRAGEPDEFGATCAFLCSNQAAFITGQNLLVDGGTCPVTV